jgi:hypothetical protein
MSADSVAVPSPQVRHPGPPLGVLALVWTVLFCAGLAVVLAGTPRFPQPGTAPDAIAAFFVTRATADTVCAMLQFGAAIVLGIFTASAVNQMRFLGVRAAGVNIALFGGFTAAILGLATSLAMWTLAQHGIATDLNLASALYSLAFGMGGVGYSAPLGLLIAGIAIPAGFSRLLPKWIVVSGLVLAAIGEGSTLTLLFPKLVLLIPLTRFPGFLWLIAAGFALPQKVLAKRAAADVNAQ